MNGIALTVLISQCLFNLDQMGVKVLGQLPQGLPSFVFPWVTDIDLVEVVLGGIAVSLVSFADTRVLSRSYAARLKMPVNPNQEMFGLGVANLASGLFQASLSAVARHVHRWPRRRARKPSLPASLVRWRSPSCSWWRPT